MCDYLHNYLSRPRDRANARTVIHTYMFLYMYIHAQRVTKKMASLLTQSKPEKLQNNDPKTWKPIKIDIPVKALINLTNRAQKEQ
jgi:hypothetical protein